MLNLVEDYKAPIDGDETGMALFELVGRHVPITVDWLLKQGDMNKYASQALIFASGSKSLPVVMKLLKAGADITADKHLAISSALQTGNLAVANLLLGYLQHGEEVMRSELFSDLSADKIKYVEPKMVTQAELNFVTKALESCQFHRNMIDILKNAKYNSVELLGMIEILEKLENCENQRYLLPELKRTLSLRQKIEELRKAAATVKKED